jgi:aminoglycoside phosphotransferase (APT) family kinase protein
MVETDNDATADLVSLLHAFFQDRLSPHRFEIAGIRRTTAGLSRENWVFDLVIDANERQELILRRDPVASLLDSDREAEIALLRCLESASLPTPRVLWEDGAGETFGRPSLIMRRERGSCDYFILGSGDLSQDERLRLGRRFCDLLVELHAVDLRSTGIEKVLTDPGESAALVALDEWHATLRRRVVASYPELEAAAVWLRECAPASARTTLVHGDFKPGNLLIEGGDIAAVLDWETAHLGDPHEDLGWITQRLRADEHQIPGLWEQDDIVARYGRSAGWDIDLDALHWWQTFASFKSSIIQLTGVQSFIDGSSDRLYREPNAHLRVLLDAMRGNQGAA